MGKLDETARLIIKKIYNKIESYEKVAMYYGISVAQVMMYLCDVDNGTVTARKVLRVEMGRLEAEKKGNLQWVASEGDRYKGGREY